MMVHGTNKCFELLKSSSSCFCWLLLLAFKRLGGLFKGVFPVAEDLASGMTKDGSKKYSVVFLPVTY